MSSRTHDGAAIRQRLEQWRRVLQVVLDTELPNPEQQDLFEKLLTADTAAREVLSTSASQDGFDESVIESLVAGTLQLWLAESIRQVDPSELQDILASQAEKVWEEAAAAYWHVSGIVPERNDGRDRNRWSGQELLDILESHFSLAHFEEIRGLQAKCDAVEVSGVVPLTSLRRDLQERAMPYAIDGFVYCVETYSLVGSDHAEFQGIRFEPDPWMISP